jgi:hypothetical protein
LFNVTSTGGFYTYTPSNGVSASQMIDNFSILLSHALLAFAIWRLMNRHDLDVEAPPVPDVEPEGFALERLRVKRKTQAPSDA